MESATPTRFKLPRALTEPGSRWHGLLAHAWLLPVLLVAIWLRFAGLSNEHLYGDEAEYAVVARYLAHDPTYLAYPILEGSGPTPFVSQPPLLLYLMAISMKIFGATDFAAMLPSVLLGIATVAVVYAIGLRLGGRTMALVGAIIIAVLPFHVQMSRRAMLDAGYVFFLMLTLYFLIAWVQTRSRRSAAWAGVATAATALAKLPGVLAVPIALGVFALVLVIALVRASRGRAKNGEVAETLKQGGLAAIPVAVGGLLYVGLLTYLEALQNLWIKLQWQLGRVDTSQAQVTEVAQMHRDWTFYLVDPKFSFGELLSGGIFALAIVGLFVALFRVGARPVRNLEHLVVPLAVLVLASFFFWSDRKEGFYLLPFAPLAAVLIGGAAVGLKDLVTWAGIRFNSQSIARAGPVALALGLVVVAVPALGAAQDSFDKFAMGDTQEKYFGYGTREAAEWIHENDPEAGQYGTLLGRFSLLWYNEQPTYHWYVDHTRMEVAVDEGKLKYVVYDEYLDLDFDESYMRHLIQKYGGTQVAEFEAGWGVVKVFELHP